MEIKMTLMVKQQLQKKLGEERFRGRLLDFHLKQAKYYGPIHETRAAIKTLACSKNSTYYGILDPKSLKLISMFLAKFDMILYCHDLDSNVFYSLAYEPTMCFYYKMLLKIRELKKFFF